MNIETLTSVDGALPANRGDLVEMLVDQIMVHMTPQEKEEFIYDELYDYYIRVGDVELEEALDIYGVEG